MADSVDESYFPDSEWLFARYSRAVNRKSAHEDPVCRFQNRTVAAVSSDLYLPPPLDTANRRGGRVDSREHRRSAPQRYGHDRRRINFWRKPSLFSGFTRWLKGRGLPGRPREVRFNLSNRKLFSVAVEWPARTSFRNTGTTTAATGGRRDAVRRKVLAKCAWISSQDGLLARPGRLVSCSGFVSECGVTIPVDERTRAYEFKKESLPRRTRRARREERVHQHPPSRSSSFVVHFRRIPVLTGPGSPGFPLLLLRVVMEPEGFC